MENRETINAALAPREIEVLTLTAFGKTRGEISQILSISEETVKVYIKRACDKLGVSNKTYAAVIALEAGLITLHPNASPQAVEK
jgi:DNA-binding CsgD family transcriptional regulator